MSSTLSPKPLLEGAVADAAWVAIDEIAQELRQHAPAPPATPVVDYSLPGGLPGLALFYGYLAEATDREEWLDLAFDYLERSVEAAGSAPVGPGLHGGLSGVSWSTDHLVARYCEPEEDPEEVSAMDEYFLGYLSDPNNHADYDLIGGLTGFGIACLEGLPRPGAGRALTRIVEILLDLQKADGSWFTAPEMLVEWQRKQAPEGYYNLGAAHGMPATVALLALAARHGIEPERSASAAKRGSEFIQAQELPEDCPAAYGSWVVESGVPTEPTRSAWCYGDPGVASALWVTASALDDDDLAKHALAIAGRAARRDPEGAGVIDAGLCHGASGLAHILHRLHRASGDSELAPAARYWFEQTLELRQPGQGIGGFQAWAPPREDMHGEIGWQDDPGFLTGSAGIGLALLAAVRPECSDWDRCLVVSGRASD